MGGGRLSGASAVSPPPGPPRLASRRLFLGARRGAEAPPAPSGAAPSERIRALPGISRLPTEESPGRGRKDVGSPPGLIIKSNNSCKK